MIDIIAKEYKGSRENPLPIGRLGENQARRVIFDLSKLEELYGEGTWKIIAERPNESVPYIVANAKPSSNGNAAWIIQSADVGVCGYGRVELRYYPNGDGSDQSIYKSQLWLTFIEDALGENAGSASPYDDILDDVNKSVEDVKAAVDEANSILANVKNVTVELTKAEYDALPEEQKLDGTIYLVTDENDDIASYADIDIDSDICSLTINANVHIGLLRLSGTLEPSVVGYNTIVTIPEAHRPLHETWFTGVYGSDGDIAFPWVARTDGRIQAYCKTKELMNVFASGVYVYD